MSIRSDVRELSGELLQAISTRVELFGLEWQQAREGLPRLLALWVVGLFCLVFALALLTLLLIVLAWDTAYRDAVVIGLCATYALAGVLLLWRVSVRLRSGALNPFDSTIEELRRDARCLLKENSPDQAPRSDEHPSGTGGAR